jgi:malonyl-CoA O-methyltransferase
MQSQDPQPTPAAINHLSTREGYDRWSSIYDGEDNPLIAMEEPVVAELLGEVRGLEIADIGCGTGRHTLQLAAAGAHVTALDFSQGMLDRARAKSASDTIRFVQHDLAKPLPLPAAKFDRVLCCLVLDHIKNLDLLFGEMGRIVKPTGLVVVSVMHPALMLRGVQARFVDPQTGVETRPESCPNRICDYVMAITRAGLRIRHMSEHAVDEALATRMPRAAKYLNWPMLLAMALQPSPVETR